MLLVYLNMKDFMALYFKEPLGISKSEKELCDAIKNVLFLKL